MLHLATEQTCLWLAIELTGRVVLLQRRLQEYTRLGIAAEPSLLTATEHAHVMRATP